jgi:hypothetical protein
MTWGDYCAYSLGQQRLRAERWEQVRKLAYVQASSMGGLEVAEAEFMPLPFDEVAEVEEFTQDELNFIL